MQHDDGQGWCWTCEAYWRPGSEQDFLKKVWLPCRKPTRFPTFHGDINWDFLLGEVDRLNCGFAQASWHHQPRRCGACDATGFVWQDILDLYIRLYNKAQQSQFLHKCYLWFNSQDVSFTATTPPSSQDCHRLQSILNLFFGVFGWRNLAVGTLTCFLGSKVWTIFRSKRRQDCLRWWWLSLCDWRSCPVALLLPAAGKKFSMSKKSFGRTLSTNVEP